LLLGATIAAACLCAATGAVYGRWAATYGNDYGELYLAFLAYLGVGALIATGIWQYRAAGLVRVALLIVLAALAGGYAAANAFAISIPQPSEPDFIAPPWGLHLAGLVVATILYVGALIEATLAISDRRTREA
jgi:hypothetical protein